jgi:hypothetical protein
MAEVSKSTSALLPPNREIYFRLTSAYFRQALKTKGKSGGGNLAEVNGGGNPKLLPPASAYFRQALKTNDILAEVIWRK